MAFKLGDAVITESNYIKYYGNVVEVRKRDLYRVKWTKPSPYCVGDTTSILNSGIRAMTLDEMKKVAKHNKLSDFKSGQRVTVVCDGSRTGREQIVTSVSKDKITTDKGPWGWGLYSSLYIHKSGDKPVEKKKKVAKKKAKYQLKNKFKVGDKVKLTTAPKWTGKVVNRKNLKYKTHQNYEVKWDGNGPTKNYAKTTYYYSAGTLSKMTDAEILAAKAKPKKNKFKVGDYVELKGSPKWAGKIIQRVNKKIRNFNYKITWTKAPHNASTGTYFWYAPEELCKITKKAATFVAPAVVKKKEISPERKKEKMSKAKVKSKAWTKKKVASKAKFKSTKGYVVRALIANGAADKAGIKVGDTIVNVDGRRINYKGALGGTLKKFKKGAKVSVTVKKPDGREVYIRKVALGGRKDSRATLGVVSGKRSAAKYNRKVETKVKKIANETKAITKDVLADAPENEFMKRARIEMEGVGALMADMKGRDALLHARNLKRKLHKELRTGMSDNTKLVNDYLTGLTEAGKEKVEKPGRTLSVKGKVVFGLLGLGAAAATAASILHFGLGLL